MESISKLAMVCCSTSAPLYLQLWVHDGIKFKSGADLLLQVKLLVRDRVDALQDQRLVHAEAEDATSREYSREKKKNPAALCLTHASSHQS
jgi:hypothetical protein